MVNLRHIEDLLDDIKRIICYYSDSIDYSSYIIELEGIIAELDAVQDIEVMAELLKLKQRAKLYLLKAKELQEKHIATSQEQMEG